MFMEKLLGQIQYIQGKYTNNKAVKKKRTKTKIFFHNSLRILKNCSFQTENKNALKIKGAYNQLF